MDAWITGIFRIDGTFLALCCFKTSQSSICSLKFAKRLSVIVIYFNGYSSSMKKSKNITKKTIGPDSSLCSTRLSSVSQTILQLIG